MLTGKSTISEMFDSVASGETMYALVPIENSTDGAVLETHNNLYGKQGLQIIEEFVLPISQTLYFQDRDKVRVVTSRDSALGQTKKNRDEFFGQDFPTELMNSTGAAVMRAANDPTVAAIGSSISADAQGLTGLQKIDNFNDRESNATTFALVKLAGELPAPTGNDKTTFTMTIPDSPGSLVFALDILARNNVELNKIKSIGREDGKVTFLMSADGHLQDGIMQNALIALETDTERDITIKRLGSYPKADEVVHETEETYDFDAAIERINREASNGAEMDTTKMIAVFTLKDHPGALRDALRPFANAGVNLTKIDSQPSGIHNEHIFYIAFDKTTENLDAILDEFKNQCHFHNLIPGGGNRK